MRRSETAGGRAVLIEAGRVVPLPTTAELLAHEFSTIIREWLTSEQLEAVRVLNIDELNPRICHSHDFCDANQAMLDAGERLGVDVLKDVELTNAAWDIAKANGFNG